MLLSSVEAIGAESARMSFTEVPEGRSNDHVDVARCMTHEIPEKMKQL
jgi:hypothetical protein